MAHWGLWGIKKSAEEERLKACWEVLGIEPTRDSQLIKAAYINKLREFQILDNPQESIPSQKACRTSQNLFSTVHVTAWGCFFFLERAYQHLLAQAEAPEAAFSADDRLAGRIMQQMEALCADTQRKGDPAEWQRLFPDDLPWPPAQPWPAAVLVLQDNPPLPKEAWQVCKRFFNWNESICFEIVYAQKKRAVYFSRLGRTSEAIVACTEAIEGFLDSESELIRTEIAAILYYQGCCYLKLNRKQEALTAYDRLISQFGDSGPKQIQEWVAKGRKKKNRIEGKGNPWLGMLENVWEKAAALLERK